MADDRDQSREHDRERQIESVRAKLGTIGKWSSSTNTASEKSAVWVVGSQGVGRAVRALKLPTTPPGYRLNPLLGR